MFYGAVSIGAALEDSQPCIICGIGLYNRRECAGSSAAFCLPFALFTPYTVWHAAEGSVLKCACTPGKARARSGVVGIVVLKEPGQRCLVCSPMRVCGRGREES